MVTKKQWKELMDHISFFLTRGYAVYYKETDLHSYIWTDDKLYIKRDLYDLVHRQNLNTPEDFLKHLSIKMQVKFEDVIERNELRKMLVNESTWFYKPNLLSDWRDK